MDNNLELEMAKAHLEHAKVDLELAEQAEKVAHAAEKEALHEIKTAIHEIEVAAPPLIRIIVNGEPFETREVLQTPNRIITQFAKKDPATNYLVQIKGKTQISYQGKGDEKITLHNGDQFITISTGPTPVSAW